MRSVWCCALKDLRRQIRDAPGLVLALTIPIVMGSLVVLAFGGRGGPAPKAQLLVADEDDSFLSGMLVEALGRVPLIQVERLERSAGAARIEAGDGSALLVVPSGFGAAVLDDQPTTLRLVTNPAQLILPAIVEQTLRILVDGEFYARRLLDEPLRELRGGPPAGSKRFPDESIVRVSTVMNHLVGRVGDYLFPPVLALETHAGQGAVRSTRSFGLLFFPGMLFMGLLFTTQAQSTDVWRELQQGTLRRAITTPQGLGPLLGGKLLAGTLVLAAVCLAALLFAVLALGLDLWRVPLGLLWSTFAGAVCLALMVLLQVHASSPRGANLLINIVLFPLLMIGGNFFPLEIMPGWLAVIGRRTPNGWALTQLQAILGGTAEPLPLVAAFAGLAAVGALALWLSARRMRRGFLGV